MLELYQFQHSAFCLKVRLALKAKKLTFKAINVLPGVGQVEIFKISGQKQLPVLKHQGKIFSDSSAIIQYLETISNEPELFPQDPIEAAMAHIIEDWADTTFAKLIRSELIQATSLDPTLREALLPQDFPQSFKEVFNNLPSELITVITELFNQRESNELLTSLEKLSNSLSCNQWLVGNSLSIADIAVASQLSLLKFPTSSGEALSGKGCPGFADNPQLEPLFNWRDHLEETILELDPKIL